MKSLVQYSFSKLLEQQPDNENPYEWWYGFGIYVDDFPIPYQCEICKRLYSNKMYSWDACAIDPNDSMSIYQILHTDVPMCNRCADNIIDLNIPYKGYNILTLNECPHGTQIECRIAFENLFKRNKPFIADEVVVNNHDFWIHMVHADEFPGRRWSKIYNQLF